ncbi:DegT/DnrJ/EryC1/StrS family aminotransferase, partial [Methylocystis suflitae]|uniref:DegT/DnrJ/EryC1/StrS family aminotransferase n=1 Tax=Methylocystis suflitae TaxID=2951405 RepID=UPI00210A25CD
ILHVKLAHLDKWNEHRRCLAESYGQELVTAGLTLPHVPNWAEPVWHLYVVRHPRRDALQKALSGAGVGTLIHYPIPPHLQEAYRATTCWTRGAFPLAERLADEVLSLPMGPHLSEEQVETIVSSVIEADTCV